MIRGFAEGSVSRTRFSTKRSEDRSTRVIRHAVLVERLHHCADDRANIQPNPRVAEHTRDAQQIPFRDRALTRARTAMTLAQSLGVVALISANSSMSASYAAIADCSSFTSSLRSTVGTLRMWAR
jgi:hypothetical protein